MPVEATKLAYFFSHIPSLIKREYMNFECTKLPIIIGEKQSILKNHDMHFNSVMVILFDTNNMPSIFLSRFQRYKYTSITFLHMLVICFVYLDEKELLLDYSSSQTNQKQFSILPWKKQAFLVYMCDKEQHMLQLESIWIFTDVQYLQGNYFDPVIKNICFFSQLRNPREMGITAVFKNHLFSLSV